LQLKAGTLDEAKNWVATLSARNKFFARRAAEQQQLLQFPKRSSSLQSGAGGMSGRRLTPRKDLVHSAVQLLNSVEDITSSSDDVTARLSTLSVKGLNAQKYKTTAHEEYFSAPSEDEEGSEAMDSGPSILPEAMWCVFVFLYWLIGLLTDEEFRVKIDPMHTLTHARYSAGMNHRLKTFLSEVTITFRTT